MNKLKYNIILSAIFWVGTYLNQEVFFWLQEGLQSGVTAEKYAILFVIFFVFSFIKSQWLRLIALSFIVFLNMFQMGHLAYYGSPAQPSEVLLFFAEAGEVYGTLKEELHLLILPTLLSIFPLGLFWYFNNKFQEKIKKAHVIGGVFLLYLIYNPIRTYVTGNTWGRQPSTQELGGMNIYLSASYFLGRILPAKLGDTKRVSPRSVKFNQIQSFDGDIVLVLGESLSANHLSIFGYGRPTTPLLEAMKGEENLFLHRGVSSGVSTDIAVAFLMNSTYGLGGGPVVYKSSQCLFKLAKDSGFHTAFYSTQSGQQLRYISSSICPKYIDDFRSLDEISPELEDPNAADDLKLLEQYSEKADTKRFIVLHQRGSHSPYNLRYKTPTFQVNDDPSKARVDHYDNSVVVFDKFMNDLLEKVKKRDRPALIVYVSDHGEGLGEQGAWGHGKLVAPSYDIPILVYSHKANYRPFKGLPTHFNVSLMLAEFLGHKSKMDYSESLSEYVILGNDIDGFAGRLKLKINDGAIKERELIRDL